MYPAAFDYVRPTSVSEAQRLLQTRPGTQILAGGHSLIPLLKLRLSAPPALVDIGGIAELKGMTMTAGTLRIGALTTHDELASSPEVRAAAPMLAEAASLIGDQQVRNVGTIGGNVAHADPASDLPTVLVSLEARVIVAGVDGDRTVAVSDFFRGMMATALREGEILRAIEVPARQPGQGMAYAKLVNPASRYAVVGAAAFVAVKDGKCETARVTVGGLTPVALRATSVEAAITGATSSAATIERAAATWSSDTGEPFLDDLFASADYRRAMAVVYVRRALTKAFERAVV